MATIAVLGTLDTKGQEHAYVAEILRQRGHQTLLIDTGSGSEPSVQPDISREEVAAAGGVDFAQPLFEAGVAERCQCRHDLSLQTPAALRR